MKLFRVAYNKIKDYEKSNEVLKSVDRAELKESK